MTFRNIIVMEIEKSHQVQNLIELDGFLKLKGKKLYS